MSKPMTKAALETWAVRGGACDKLVAACALVGCEDTQYNRDRVNFAILDFAGACYFKGLYDMGWGKPELVINERN